MERIYPERQSGSGRRVADVRNAIRGVVFFMAMLIPFRIPLPLKSLAEGLKGCLIVCRPQTHIDSGGIRTPTDQSRSL